jgi:putative DNA primase/helicase
MDADIQIAAQSACAGIGVIFRAVPIDGRFHQLDAEGKSPRNGAGRIRLFPDGEGGQVWNYITDENRLFWAKDDKTLSPGEQEERRRRVKVERDRADRELAEARKKAAQLAVEIWKVSLPPAGNPYLVRKQVESTDTLREIPLDNLVNLIGYHPKIKGEPITGDRVLIVPVRSDKGITTIEMIDDAGRKPALADGQKKGCFWATDKLPEGNGSGLTIGVGEGVATILSYLQATGCIGIAALSSGNLKVVAEYFRRRYQKAIIVIISDIGNGEQAAQEAARCTNSMIVRPVLPPDSKGSDLNDVHVELGIDEARRQIEASTKVVSSEATTMRPEAAIINEQTDSWLEPVLFGDIQTPTIPCSILPGWLGDYAAAVAKSTDTPPSMSVMMALSTVAACVQKRFQVARTPEHVEPLALWTVTALPPSSRKSAIFNFFTGPLSAWEKEMCIAEKAERSRIAVARSVLEERIKVLHTRAAKADNVIGRNELIDEACKLLEEMPETLIPPQVYAGDVTPERLQTLMMEHGERMALLEDEGGIFAVMAGLYNGGKANIDIFLKSHAGSAVRVDRQGRSAYLDNPALTFGLCIQPDIIRRLSDTSFRGNGCLARFLFCLPVSNIGSRTLHTASMQESAESAYQAGINALLNIPPVKNEQGKEQARTITLDYGATQVWEAFFYFIEPKMGEGKELEAIQDWAGKLAGAALRIAGIMAIVENGEGTGIISEATMIRSVALCKLLITHAKAAFDLIDDDDSQNDAKHVYRWILDKGNLSFKRRDAQQELPRFRDVDRLIKALSVLSKRYIISEPDKIKSATGRGGPSILYYVNPAIFDR